MSDQNNPTTNEENEEAVMVDASPATDNATTEDPTANTTTSADQEQETAQEEEETATAEEGRPQPETAPSERTAPRADQSERLPSRDVDDNYDEDDDYDDDDYDDDYEDDEDLYVDGPAQYVQRERGGRGRRIGSDIRVSDIDYKNVTLLSRFLDRRGRILSRRRTRVSAKVQRRIVKAIKRARHLALLPYTGDHTRIVRKRR